MTTQAFFFCFSLSS